MYEKLLLSIENRLMQSKRTNAELKANLHELFDLNNAEYERIKNWYDSSTLSTNVFEKMEYEHYVIENYKKSVYGDSYEIKEYKNGYLQEQEQSNDEFSNFIA